MKRKLAIRQGLGTKSNTRLFKRFSQLTGIPLAELEARQVISQGANAAPPKDELGFDSPGAYYRGLHETELFPDVLANGKRDLKIVEAHEQRHGLQRVSDQRHLGIQRLRGKHEERVRRAAKQIGNTQPITPPGEIAKWKELHNKRQSDLVEPTNPKGTVQYAKQLDLPRVVPQEKLMQTRQRRQNTLRVYRTHGADGLLLLYACPPRSLDALQIPAWEKEMVDYGYLHPRGGLTRKGKQFFRGLVHSSAIWQALEHAKSNRELIAALEATKGTTARIDRIEMQRKKRGLPPLGEYERYLLELKLDGFAK
jgi:hypothetical protein